MTIIVRPHPSENFKVYNDIAAKCERVKVTNEGNVIPWLLASKTMVHNGCTTGLEAYALGVPAISYLATFNEYYDYEFQGLPTKLSYQSFNFEELETTLAGILKGELGVAGGEERQALIDYYLAAQNGRLACERIVDILEESGYGRRATACNPLRHLCPGLGYSPNSRLPLTNLEHAPPRPKQAFLSRPPLSRDPGRGDRAKNRAFWPLVESFRQYQSQTAFQASIHDPCLTTRTGGRSSFSKGFSIRYATMPGSVKCRLEFKSCI